MLVNIRIDIVDNILAPSGQHHVHIEGNMCEHGPSVVYVMLVYTSIPTDDHNVFNLMVSDHPYASIVCSL